MSTPKKNTRRDAENRRLMEAWGPTLTLNAARNIRNKQIESGAPSISDAMPNLLRYFDAELRDFGSLCLGVVPDPGTDYPIWLPAERGTPIFAPTSRDTRTVAISGASNTGKTTLLHVLIEQAAATTSPHDTAIAIDGADPELLSSRVAHLGERISRISCASSSDRIGIDHGGEPRSQTLVFFDDLDLALIERPQLWDFITAAADRKDVRIFFTAATAVPRTVPRQLLSPAVLVNLQGGTLPGTATPPAPWMFASTGTEGMCFGDLPVGSSPVDPNGEYQPPHRNALALLYRGNPDMEGARRWPILRLPVQLGDVHGHGSLPRTEVPIGVVVSEDGTETTPWGIDFDARPNLVIAGDPKSGRSTTLQTLILSSAVREGTPAYLIVDGGSDMAAVKDSPNVAAYASVTDTDMVDRILGEVMRSIERREEERNATIDGGPKFTSTEDFLDSWCARGRRGDLGVDKYRRIVLVIDGIGRFLGEERAEQAKRLRPILDRGAKVGVHLVFTADAGDSSNSGNYAHYSMQVRDSIQLSSTSYAGAIFPAATRLELPELIPAKIPGRTVHPESLLPARIAVPSIRTSQEDISKVSATRLAQESAQWLNETQGEDGHARVAKLRAVDTVVPFERIRSQFDERQGWTREQLQKIITLGVDVATTEVVALPDNGRNLIMYGERGSGRTSTTRAVIESVTRSYTPEEAVIAIIDPRRDLLSERDRLLESGHLRPAKDVTSSGAGETYRPHGYASSKKEIEALALMLTRVMGSRRPDEHATVKQLHNRTYFTGPEIYVIIDNFDTLAEGFMAKSVFDEVEVRGETVTKLIATGVDLGVHFIVTDSSGLAERVKCSPFLQGLRDSMMAPILQLSGQTSGVSPISGAFHLKPRRQAPGRGRLIVDAEDYAAVQVGWVPPTGSA